MATPLVAGAAALVRQHLEAELGTGPSAELLKAFLINGAQKLDPADARPNPVSGWGRVDVKKTVLPEDPRTALYAENEIEASKTFPFSFTVTDSSEELRATIVWADPPGESLVHNLDLTLVDPAENEHFMEGLTPGSHDRENNVEGVDIESPVLGEWVLRVTSSLLTTPEQPFALVVSGAVEAGSGG